MHEYLPQEGQLGHILRQIRYHSVDSERLARDLGRLAAEEQRRLGLYLQVDFTGEATKHGLDEEGLQPALAWFRTGSVQHARLHGSRPERHPLRGR